jgi:arylsulfatase
MTALLCAVTPAQAQTKKPNVVVIFCDDMGWGDPGCFGGGETRGAPTPNIDRMAAEGARFTQWYGQASCTGRPRLVHDRAHPDPLGALGGHRPRRSQQAARRDADHRGVLQEERLHDYMSGKWHLGDVPDSYPIAHGFDEMKHMLCYYAGVYGYRDPELHPWFPNWDRSSWRCTTRS